MSWFGGKEAGKRAKLAAHGKRRREREKAARTERRRLSIEELRAMYNATCQLCGRRVVDPKHGSIEHPVPLSKGGVDDETNQTYAHARCNSKKGNRTKPKRKGLRRSMWRPKIKSKIPEGSPDVF